MMRFGKSVISSIQVEEGAAAGMAIAGVSFTGRTISTAAEARMPRIAIIKPAYSALLIPFSISAVPQEAARADAASGHGRFQLAARRHQYRRMRRQRLLRNGGGPSNPFASAHRGTTAHVSGYYSDTRSTEISDARPVQMPAGDLYYFCFGALDPGEKPGPNVEHRMADFYGSRLRNRCPISSQYLFSGWATGKGHWSAV
jgi:hypothetical protein